MRCDLGRVSSSPHTSISPFPFVWLVCLIWNLFQEGCLASCVGLGHWHLSSPLLGGLAWSLCFLPALTPCLCTHSQGYTGPPAVHQGTGRPVTPWDNTHPNTGLGGSGTCYFTVRVGRRKKALALNSCFTALITKEPLKWNPWPYRAEPWACDEFSWHPNVAHWHEKPQGLEFVSIVCGYVCVWLSEAVPGQEPALLKSPICLSQLLPTAGPAVIGGKCPESLVRHKAAKNH